MRRCYLCGAYLDSGERCDCEREQTEKHRPRIKRQDEASRTAENWRFEKYINDQYQRWFER